MVFCAMWIAIASFIYVFDMKKPEDENGHPNELMHDYYESALVYTFFCRRLSRSDVLSFSIPKPFKCIIKPRSKEFDSGQHYLFD